MFQDETNDAPAEENAAAEEAVEDTATEATDAPA